ncbi:MAG TPA: PTS sugar transporter subunit IIA [Planctomycetota bacterium]|nr:PTS sugar transporter subunit IIA [Planctomycetota bacterium]
MKSLLGALQDGRLVELPSNEKVAALKTLAHLIEAVPEMGRGVDLVEEVLKRENQTNSGIGLGVACPHVRVPGNGELLCSVGWSPAGIDYGSVDGKKVHLVAMYFIPDIQKNAYLKEISGLAQAVKKVGDIQSIAKAEDVPAVREHLLGWVSSAIEAGVSQVRARMIHLEARQAQATGAEASQVPGLTLTGVGQILPVIIVTLSETQRVVLCENRELAAAVEKDPSVGVLVKQGKPFDRAGYRFVYRNAVLYDPARPLQEYIAVKLG